MQQDSIELSTGTTQNCAFNLETILPLAIAVPEIQAMIANALALHATHISKVRLQERTAVSADTGLAYELNLEAGRLIRSVVETIDTDQVRAKLLGETPKFPTLSFELCPNGISEYHKLPYLIQQVEDGYFLAQVQEPKVARYLHRLGLTDTIAQLQANNEALREAILDLGHEDLSTSTSAVDAKEAYLQVCTVIAGRAACGDRLCEAMLQSILHYTTLRLTLQKRAAQHKAYRAKSQANPATI